MSPYLLESFGRRLNPAAARRIYWVENHVLLSSPSARPVPCYTSAESSWAWPLRPHESSTVS